VIAGFAGGDTIIVPDFTYAVSDSYVVNAASLALSGVASQSLAFQLVGDQGDTFLLSADGTEPGAGTVITLLATPAPTALTLAAASDSGVPGDDITNHTSLQITGLGIPGDTITLYDGTIDVGTGTVDGGGTWAISTGALAAGVQDFAATQTGTTSAAASAPSATLVVNIVTAAAAPATLTLAPASDSGVQGDDITNVTTPRITGTGSIGDTVTLYDGATIVGTGTVGGSGTWDITTTALLAGSQTLTATESDVAGNVSPASAPLTLTIDTAIPAAPAGLTLAPASDSGVAGDDITNDTTPEIIGTGIAGETITLHDGATIIGTGTVGSDGTWGIVATALIAGSHTLTATETDVAGNVSGPSGTLVLTIDTTIPEAPAGLTLAPASDSGVQGDDITNVTTPTITGTGIAGETIALYSGTIVVGTGTVGSDGSWEIATATLLAGSHILTATETDVAGNVSAASGTLALTIETTIPADPASLTLAPASDSGAPGDDITNVITPQITGTGIAGETVTLYDGATIIGTGTVANDGTWAITATMALAAGGNTLTATESDGAGNVSPASSPLVLTIATAAAAPTITEDVADTNPAEPLVQGDAPDDSTVIIYQGSTAVGTVVATADGTWSFAYPTVLAAGTYDLTATATDLAGNLSPASAPLTIAVNADHSYAVVSPPDSAGDTVDHVYDPAGVLDEVDTLNAQSLLLTKVTNTQAVIEIYDAAGTLIGTITQPSNSATSQPVFTTTGLTLSATTGSGPIGSNISLIAESNIITSQGNDTVEAGPGADTITATGPTISIQGGSGSLVLVAGSGSSTVVGGSGVSTLFGGAGGGYLQGGSAGGNILAAADGATSLVAGGAGDVLAGGAGSNTLVMLSHDIAFAGSGSSTVFGGAGDAMVGGTGNSVMVAGSAGGQSMFAGAGNSTMFGGGGDFIAGGGGTALIVDTSAAGSSAVFATGSGNTTLFGGAGSELVFATGGGNAVINAAAGSAEIVLGSGATTVNAGSGADFFDVTAGAAGGDDLIAGFKVGTDQIRLFGYNLAATQQSAAGGNITLTLSDNTRITLLGISQLAANSVI
jgi:hypothetical protein